jgi:hypothetical protein
MTILREFPAPDVECCDHIMRSLSAQQLYSSHHVMTQSRARLLHLLP